MARTHSSKRLQLLIDHRDHSQWIDVAQIVSEYGFTVDNVCKRALALIKVADDN